MIAHIKSTNIIEWWLKGLSYLIPVSLRRMLQSIPDRITIEFRDEQAIIKHYAGGSTSPANEKLFPLDAKLHKASVVQWLNEYSDSKTEFVLLIPEDIILRKNLVLPAAAATNLRQVLGFEMERKTPFSPDQAYFDFTITGHDKSTNKLNTVLFIAPRDRVDPYLNMVRGWSVSLDAIRPILEPPSDITINLLSLDSRPDLPGDTSKLTLLLASLAFILFIALLYVPLIEQEQYVNVLEAEIDKSRKAALKLQNLKDERDTILDQVFFLADRRADEISSIELLNEITRIIPDDTWLTRLVMKKGEIQIQGESDNASTLIQTIESSDFFSDVEFRSPVTQNKVTKKEKFYVSAKFLSGQNT
jgi:general secretion pathway protein L